MSTRCCRNEREGSQWMWASLTSTLTQKRFSWFPALVGANSVCSPKGRAARRAGPSRLCAQYDLRRCSGSTCWCSLAGPVFSCWVESGPAVSYNTRCHRLMRLCWWLTRRRGSLRLDSRRVGRRGSMRCWCEVWESRSSLLQ